MRERFIIEYGDKLRDPNWAGPPAVQAAGSDQLPPPPPPAYPSDQPPPPPPPPFPGGGGGGADDCDDDAPPALPDFRMSMHQAVRRPPLRRAQAILCLVPPQQERAQQAV